MKKNKLNHSSATILSIFVFVLVSIPFCVNAYKASDFNWRPPFTVTQTAKPSITIIFDTSNSMHRMAYATMFEKTNEQNLYESYGEDYNASKPHYYGYFDNNSTYLYNNGTTYEEKYFYKEENGNSGWSGKFLNWATMHRIDVMRKVMTGGRYDDNSECFEIVTTNSLTRRVIAEKENLPVNLQNINTYDDKIILRQIPNTRTLVVEKIIEDKSKYIYEQIAGGFELRIKAPGVTPIGVLETKDDQTNSTFAEKARLALFRYYDLGTGNDHKGGRLLVPMDDGVDNIDDIKYYINNFSDVADEPLGGTAPLAETLYNVAGYIMQMDITNAAEAYAPKFEVDSFEVTKGNFGDPFYFKTSGKLEYCTPQNVIFITPGESTFGDAIPIGDNKLIPPIGEYPVEEGVYTDPITEEKLQANTKAYVIDTARWMRSQDLRSDLPGSQLSTLYVVQAFGKGSQLLEHAAIFGGFRDQDGDKMPVNVTAKGNKIKFDNINWQATEVSAVFDKENDQPSFPANYFWGEDGSALEMAISSAFDLATRNLMSGTAAAVTSQTRSGAGAVYQALFFPPTDSSSNEIIAPDWSGQVHAFFVDNQGNMREDSNENHKLDLVADKIIKFIDIGTTVLIYRYIDSNGDSQLTSQELNTYEEVKLQDIKFLWRTTDWLNSISDTAILQQRSPYKSLDKKRHIFTFVDTNGYQVPTGTEIQPFVLDSEYANIKDSTKFYSYLTLFESSSGSIGSPLNPDFEDYAIQQKLAKRQIDYIRGKDFDIKISDSEVNDPTRSRTTNGATWRLGDIVTSSPLIVGAPSANYHIIYSDKTFAEYYHKYKNRRQVVYVGANDGMLHAFNGGFYNTSGRSFETTLYNSETQFDLGAELWAYVPFNLLPHLRWLMNPEYGGGLHVPYVNLMPRAFDVRIFPDDTDHPKGWGTILVAGMGLGGGKIDTDVNKDGSGDRTMSSAYIILDITNPENPPELLGEVRLPGLGFTTSSPAIMPMTTANTNSTYDNNQWYLVFGSGPANSIGVASHEKLDHVTSEQSGKLFILDLKSLATTTAAEEAIKVYNGGSFKRAINSTGSFSSNSLSAFDLDAGSFIGDPATVDFDFNSKDTTKEFKTDAIYFGTVSGSPENPNGKMYRIFTDNNIPNNTGLADWRNSLLIDVGQPVVAAPTIVTDKTKNIWVYFGSGRFFESNDIPQDGDVEKYWSFFGIKDPVWNATSPFLTSPVSTNNLFNSTRVHLQDNGMCYSSYSQECVDVHYIDDNWTNSTPAWDWNKLLTESDKYTGGWRLDFTEPWERVLGQASALGGAVLFTSYLPGIDICMVEGQSRLYGLYYKTGTAYYNPIFRSSGDIFTTFVGLGKGMATTPTIHVGEGGATAFVQTSSGAIIPIETSIDIGAKTLFWRKNVN